MSTLANPDFLDLHPVALRHLPIVRKAIGWLGIREVFDELLPADRRADVSDGDCATVMIANILGGRVALYNMGEWLEATDVGLLLWEGCPASAFGDDRLGKTLDHIWDAGADNVLSAVATRYLHSKDAPREYCVLNDTTSIVMQGAYLLEDYDVEGAPVPKHGHSKDFRPDLKQLIYGVSLHGAACMPLVGTLLDGNTPDHLANRIHVDKLAALLPPEDEVTLVADCKFADAERLGKAWRTGFHCVTLLRRTYKLRAELVEAVRADGTSLAEAGRYPGRTLEDPERGGTSFTRPLPVLDPLDGALMAVEHWFLVLESSRLARAHEAGVPDDLKRAEKALRSAFEAAGKTAFNCEADARHALGEAAEKATLHVVEARVIEVEEPLRRERRGRPRVGETVPTRTVWRVELVGLTVDAAAMEREAFHARHFVQLTDHLDEQSWPDECVFETPAAVAPVFLKLPHRIAAPGLVFLQALMVRNWIPARIRAQLAATAQKLANVNDRPTSTPTTDCFLRVFQHIASVLVRDDGGRILERRVHGMSSLTERAPSPSDSSPRSSGLDSREEILEVRVEIGEM